ncbi:MAG: right-handed parallel beta-helix repeat-containing protein [Bacteroidales bacterium]|nr:right-handed parallel beta-helix repeat-containing protein [Bacteroidales bacterium]
MRIISFFLLMTMMSVSCLSREYFVSPKGNDNNPGTLLQPFSTIQRAVDVMMPGDVCNISGGVYPESIRIANSGTRDQPIVFKPQTADDQVIVTGADPVPAENWEKLDDHIFRIGIELELGHENQVFIGDRTMVEARWPNVGDDLFKPGLSVMDEATSPDLIVDDDLPVYDYSNAHVWIHAPKYWSDWTTIITGKPDRNSIQIEDIAPYGDPYTHVATEGAEFFIFGCKDALDAENEWYYDKEKRELLIFRKDGKLPDEGYTVKRRMYAFDLSGASNIEIHGLTIHGSTITTDETSENILLNRLKIYYPYYSSQANRYYGSQTDKGIDFQGKNCTIRNSEVAYSTGCGVILQGENNKVLNCYIHDTDLIGTYASCVQLRGKGNVISHCTLTRSGRTVIDYGNMYQALLQNCDMSYSGLLTSDLGLTYGNVIEGGNSEVRYNLMHDNADDHLDMGLYYDHGTQNIISHHNIIWGVGFSAFHINHYAAYHIACNNTFNAERNGFLSTWGYKYEPDLLECRFINNLFSGPAETTAGNYYWNANISGYDDFDPEQPMLLPEVAAGKGIFIKGISAVQEGGRPSVGAIEFEGMTFRAGHDFEDPPEMNFERSKPVHRNLLVNSAFEHEDHLWPWERHNAHINTINYSTKMHTTIDTAVVRMGRYSIELPSMNSEIFQEVEELLPGKDYTFIGHLRVPWNEDAVLGVRFPDGTEYLSPRISRGAPNWSRCRLNFTLPENVDAVEVFVRRRSGGEGKVFVDDLGLVRR